MSGPLRSKPLSLSTRPVPKSTTITNRKPVKPPNAYETP
jgi:hypothetical protein